MRRSHFRGKGSKLRISNPRHYMSYQMYVSNDVSLWRDPKVPVSQETGWPSDC